MCALSKMIILNIVKVCNSISITATYSSLIDVLSESENKSNDKQYTMR